MSVIVAVCWTHLAPVRAGYGRKDRPENFYEEVKIPTKGTKSHHRCFSSNFLKIHRKLSGRPHDSGREKDNPRKYLLELTSSIRNRGDQEQGEGERERAYKADLLDFPILFPPENYGVLCRGTNPGNRKLRKVLLIRIFFMDCRARARSNEVTREITAMRREEKRRFRAVGTAFEKDYEAGTSQIIEVAFRRARRKGL